MAREVRLRILDAAELTEPGQLFFCVPLKCTLLARACTLRQQDAKRPRTVGDAARFGPRDHLGQCARCELGELVVQRVGAPALRKLEQLSAVGPKRRAHDRQGARPKAPPKRARKWARRPAEGGEWWNT